MQNYSENSPGEMKDKIRQDASAAKEDMAEMASEMAREKAETGKRQAADKVDHLSDAIDSVAASLSEQDKAGLASYAHQASEKLSMLAQHINGRSLDELADDAKQLARRRPGAFMLGSVALGFGLSRFIKASERRTDYRDDMDYVPRSSTEEMDAAAKMSVEYEPGSARSHPGSTGTPSSGVDALQ